MIRALTHSVTPSVTACGGATVHVAAKAASETERCSVSLGEGGCVGSLFEGAGRRRLTEGVEARHDIRNVVLFDRTALVVQAETVGAHVVEPDFVRAAVTRFRED